MLPTAIETTASAASAGFQSCGDRPERHLEEPRQRDEGGGLGRHRHEGGDRRGGSLVDVGRPLVEGGHRRLEGEAGRNHRGADQDEGVVAVVSSEPLGDPGEVGRPRAAVEQREAVEHGRRPDRADDQVLEAGLERALRAPGRGAEDVERDGEQLERDEEGDQVLRLRDQGHAQHRAEQQAVERAMPGLLRCGLADREQHSDRSGEAGDQRRREAEGVEPQRARDQVLVRAPLPDRQAGRGRQDRDRQVGHREATQPRDQPEQQHDAEPGRQGDDGREPGVVDVGSVEGHRSRHLGRAPTRSS